MTQFTPSLNLDGFTEQLDGGKTTTGGGSSVANGPEPMSKEELKSSLNLDGSLKYLNGGNSSGDGCLGGKNGWYHDRKNGSDFDRQQVADLNRNKTQGKTENSVFGRGSKRAKLRLAGGQNGMNNDQLDFDRLIRDKTQEKTEKRVLGLRLKRGKLKFNPQKLKRVTIPKEVIQKRSRDFYKGMFKKNSMVQTKKELKQVRSGFDEKRGLLTINGECLFENGQRPDGSGRVVEVGWGFCDIKARS